MIFLEHISKSFQTNNKMIEVLNDINLHIVQGEIFGVIGLSGAGKSTLIRCINYLEKPTAGKVIFDGKELGKLKPKELRILRRSIGMIFQGFNLLSQRNVLKNVCYPLEIAGVPRIEARKKATELLNLVGLSDKAETYPSQLSGGQKQRVAIARALANNPKVLLCDEATSALDPNTTRSILELLQKINRTLGVTIVIVTHEMQIIQQICNRVAVIDKSKIIEIGNVKEIFLRPQSDMAKQLILPKTEVAGFIPGKRCLRIIFDGNSAFEPIISSITLECRVIVNILFANTKSIDGRAFGEMILQLPDNEASISGVLAYLDEKGIFYKQETFLK